VASEGGSGNVHILKYFVFVGSALLGLLFLVAASIDSPPRENPLLQNSASMVTLRSIANHGEKRASSRAPFVKLQPERVAAIPDREPEDKSAVTARPNVIMNARAEVPAKKSRRHATAKTSKRKFEARLRQRTQMVENVQTPVGYRAW